MHVSWRDASDSRGLTRVYAHPAAPAALIAAGASLAGVADAASGATPIGYTVIYPYHVTDQAASGPQLVNVTGVFVFLCEGSDQYLVLTVPGIKQSAIELVSPYVAIDTNLPNIQNLVSTIIFNNVCNPFGYRAISLQSAFWQFVP